MTTRHLILGAFAILCATSAQATVLPFQGSGTSAGVAVSAKADFDVTAGQLVLTLENTTPHTADAGQLLTGIRFSITTGVTPVAAATFTAAAAGSRTIAGNGTYVVGASSSLLSTWEKTVSGSVFQLDFNPNAQFAIVGPADGEIGAAAGVYTGNGSINGNPGHNPYAARLATFTLANAGITSASQIGNVTFLYNTALSQLIPGAPVSIPPPVPIPEPASIGFGVALLGVCVTARLKSRRRAAGVIEA